MPGNREAAWSGHAHQIFPARNTIACAPPKTWPSLVSTRISCSSRLDGMPRREATRGSCKGARPKPRFSRGARKRRARDRQSAHSPSKKTQPRAARRPFLSVISEVSEIISHQKKRPFRRLSPTLLRANAAAYGYRPAVLPAASWLPVKGCETPRTGRSWW